MSQEGEKNMVQSSSAYAVPSSSHYSTLSWKAVTQVIASGLSDRVKFQVLRIGDGLRHHQANSLYV